MRGRRCERTMYRSEKAGCVPVRRNVSGEWEVLLVQSRRSKDSWAFPKGGVEPGESDINAAVRETVEEGGVLGTVSAKLGVWTLARRSTARVSGTNKARLRMWLLLVDHELPSDDRRWAERSYRVRAWFPFNIARSTLADDHYGPRPDLVQVLDAAMLALAIPASPSSATKPLPIHAQRDQRESSMPPIQSLSSSSPSKNYASPLSLSPSQRAAAIIPRTDASFYNK